MVAPSKGSTMLQTESDISDVGMGSGQACSLDHRIVTSQEAVRLKNEI